MFFYKLNGFEGVGEGKRWGRIDTYGPKLVENIVQATARDLLAEALLDLDQLSYLSMIVAQMSC